MVLLARASALVLAASIAHAFTGVRPSRHGAPLRGPGKLGAASNGQGGGGGGSGGGGGVADGLRRACREALLLAPIAAGMIQGPAACWAAAGVAGAETAGAEVAVVESAAGAPAGLLDQDARTLDEAWELVDKYFLFRDRIVEWPEKRRAAQAKLTGDVKKDYAAINGMVGTLGDKYTRLVDAEAFGKLLKYDVLGIGLLLAPDEVSREITVSSPPVPQSAAERAGVQKGDAILSLNGVALRGKTAFELLELVTNEESKVLSVEVRAAAGGEPRTLSLPRDFSSVKDPVDVRISGEGADAVGYVRLKEFNALAKFAVRDALQSFADAGVTHAILDLRGNGGGAFQGAVSIAELLLPPKQLVVSVVDSEEKAVPFLTSENANQEIVRATQRMTVILWTNGRTASASEVLVGALRDNCRAVVQGGQTFGKGIIQGVYGLQDGGGLIMTVAKYRTPSGAEIQGKGIAPDLKAPIPRAKLPTLTPDLSSVNFAEAEALLRTCSPAQAP